MNSKTTFSTQSKMNSQQNESIYRKKTGPETYVSFFTSNTATDSSSKNPTTEEIFKIVDISNTLKWNNSMSANDLELTPSKLLNTPKGKDISHISHISKMSRKFSMYLV